MLSSISPSLYRFRSSSQNLRNRIPCWGERGMARCPVCDLENAVSAVVCRGCSAALDGPATMSVGGAGAAAPFRKPVSSHPSLSGGFVPGTLISDRYRIVALLGLGGMGEVYSSDDLKLGQRVALKFLPEDRGRSENWRERFYAEVRMARQVSHPNVCRVYDVGENNGRLFLSMEHVDGEDLASLLRRIGRLPDDKAVEVAHQLCAGLAAAHRSGVLHRDLKPANVMIDGKGLVRITDFGLAIATTEAGSNAIPAGTPGYFAPDSLGGAAPSVQSDLYALGLVLYELFTGKRAFPASGLVELRRLQAESSPAPPRSIVKSLDPAVERAILRCLHHEPSRRPSSAMSVAAALPGSDPLAAAIAAGETPSPEMVAAAGPWGSLRPRLAWAYFAATVGLILGTSVFLAPRGMDWELARMDKSPEVLADRAEELANKLGYSEAVDRASWVGSEGGYRRYASRNPEGKDWKAAPGSAWPSPVTLFYRQSPDWMTPTSPTFGPPMVMLQDPPHETAGMVDFKLDMQGHLLFLRAVPPQAEHSGSTQMAATPEWELARSAGRPGCADRLLCGSSHCVGFDGCGFVSRHIGSECGVPGLRPQCGCGCGHGCVDSLRVLPHRTKLSSDSGDHDRCPAPALAGVDGDGSYPCRRDGFAQSSGRDAHCRVRRHVPRRSHPRGPGSCNLPPTHAADARIGAAAYLQSLVRRTRRHRAAGAAGSRRLWLLRLARTSGKRLGALKTGSGDIPRALTSAPLNLLLIISRY